MKIDWKILSKATLLSFGVFFLIAILRVVVLLIQRGDESFSVGYADFAFTFNDHQIKIISLAALPIFLLAVVGLYFYMMGKKVKL